MMNAYNFNIHVQDDEHHIMQYMYNFIEVTLF